MRRSNFNFNFKYYFESNNETFRLEQLIKKWDIQTLLIINFECLKVYEVWNISMFSWKSLSNPLWNIGEVSQPKHLKTNWILSTFRLELLIKKWDIQTLLITNFECLKVHEVWNISMFSWRSLSNPLWNIEDVSQPKHFETIEF